MKIPIKQIKTRAKTTFFFASLLFIVIFGVLKLAPTNTDAATTDYWKATHNTTTNQLDFNLNINDTTDQPAALSILSGGNVGIGTTAPAAPLHVVGGSVGITTGGARIGHNNLTQAVDIGYGGIQKYSNNGNNNLFLDAYSNGNIILQTNATGTVGIGTPSPTDKLSVNGSTVLGSTAAGGVKIMSGGATQGVIKPSIGNGVISITDDSGQADRGITIGNAGAANSARLGIGTGAPSGSLHVAQNDGAGGGAVRAPIILSRYWANDNDTRASAIFHSYNGNNEDILAFGVSGGSGSYSNPANYSQSKMVIQANGRIGLRTQNPTSDLHIKQATDSQPAGGIRLDSAGAGGWATIMTGGNTRLHFFVNNTAKAVTFDSEANIYAGLYNPSSKELKENYSEIDNMDILSKIDQLPVMKWNYKDQSDSIGHIGPFAEDFYNAFKLGASNKDIFLSDEVGITMAGVKALSEKVNKQQNEIDLLRKEIGELKKTRE